MNKVLFVFLLFLSVDSSLGGVGKARELGDQVNLQLEPRTMLTSVGLNKNGTLAFPSPQNHELATHDSKILVSNVPEPAPAPPTITAAEPQQPSQIQNIISNLPPREHVLELAQRATSEARTTLATAMEASKTYSREAVVRLTTYLASFPENTDPHTPHHVKFLRALLHVNSRTAQDSDFDAIMSKVVIIVAFLVAMYKLGSHMTTKFKEQSDEFDKEFLYVCGFVFTGFGILGALSSFTSFDTPLLEIGAENSGIGAMLVVGSFASVAYCVLRHDMEEIQATENKVQKGMVYAQIGFAFLSAVLTLLALITADDAARGLATGAFLCMGLYILIAAIEIQMGKLLPGAMWKTTFKPGPQPPHSLNQPRIILSTVLGVLVFIMMICSIPFIPLGTAQKVISVLGVLLYHGLEIYWFFLPKWMSEGSGIEELLGIGIEKESSPMVPPEDVRHVLNLEDDGIAPGAFQSGFHLIRKLDQTNNEFWAYIQIRKSAAAFTENKDQARLFVKLLNELLNHVDKHMAIEADSVYIPSPILINPVKEEKTKPGSAEDVAVVIVDRSPPPPPEDEYIRQTTDGKFTVLLEKNMGYDNMGELVDSLGDSEFEGKVELERKCQKAKSIIGLRLRCWFNFDKKHVVVLPVAREGR